MMNTEERVNLEARIKEAFSDQEFTKELFEMEKAEDAQAKLQEKGIKMTLDEVKALGKALQQAHSNNGELSEDALENVAGGIAAEITAGIILGVCTIGGACIERWGW